MIASITKPHRVVCGQVFFWAQCAICSLGLFCALGLFDVGLAAASKPDPKRLEVGALPVLTGDSDIGFGFGAIGTFVRFDPHIKPYRWRLEVLWLMTVKADPDGEGVDLPYHDDTVDLDLPGLFGGKVRLNLTLRFRRYTTSGYYGFGNDSSVDHRARDANGRYHLYDRIYPSFDVQTRIKLGGPWRLLLGGRFIYNWVRVYEGSLLQTELAAAESDDELAALLHGVRDFPQLEANLGLIYDSRDHEYAPTRGFFHEASWRFSPGVAMGTDYAYGGANVTVRFYIPLAGEKLVLAARAMADLIVGDPPFFELARHGGLFPNDSLGGGKGIRGVPLQRYHGKVKLFSNLELRSKLFPFGFWGQRFNLGALAFFDVGRTWAELGSSRFDGEGLGLKLGVGGGLRVQWGETFIVRGDVAWSPDAEPVAFYIDVSHIF
ncbi:MAG: BamA/TamA family outer membrane protein [Deltaproteobacteria bacterium]|nr:BamA/TamA family outer membrane protein [Deltaproteobacteria bacterium]